MNIWFTSDTHYHHKNIVRGYTAWEEDADRTQRTRDFDTLEEHDATLVENINKYVKENDILYHLGDFSFGGIESIWNFRKKLNCKTIHLLYGNHDHHIINNKQIEFVPAHDLFASVQHILDKKIGGHKFFLSHYSHRTWPKAHHGVIHLYGHSHGSLPEYYQLAGPFDGFKYEITGNRFKCMDVGIDTHPEFRPYHINEILQIMEYRIPLLVDHHNSKTN